MCGSKEKFEWSQEAQEAFWISENKILNDAMLAHPNFAKPFNVHADSSAY